ncbi:hypothetical protein ACFQ0G_05170 [Streptomyces chiangmaiensis]
MPFGTIEKFMSGSLGQRLDAVSRIAFGMTATEQPRERAMDRLGDRVVADVQQHDLLVRGGAGDRGVHAGGPGAFGDPDDDAHGLLRLSVVVGCRSCAASPTAPGRKQGAGPIRRADIACTAVAHRPGPR